MLTILSLVCFLVAVVCRIINLIHAFQNSVGMGLLCLCVPFAILWYAFAKFEHEKKGLIIAAWLGAGALYTILSLAAGAAG